MREAYVKYKTAPKRLDDLVVKARTETGERIIPSGKWWINRNTPVGEDAEYWERKPHGGKKLIEQNNILAIIRK